MSRVMSVGGVGSDRRGRAGARSARIAALLLVALASAPASAMSMYWQALGPAGLGHVAAGDPLAYQHSFDVANADVLGATLFVFTVDQPGCVVRMQGVPCEVLDVLFQPEAADIDVAGSDFASGSATLHLFSGAVTQALIDSGNVLDVVVTATRGDFYVWRSVLLVAYQAAGGAGGGAAAAAPEPGAAVLFGIGTLAVARASRRRR
jgi:hypothetical protein